MNYIYEYNIFAYVCICMCVCVCVCVYAEKQAKELNKKFDFIIDKICSSLIPVTYELPSFLLDKDFEL